MHFISASCLLLTLAGIQAEYEDCDYVMKIEPNMNYFINNTEYPNKYKPDTSCRWYIHAPPGSKIFLKCDKMDIPWFRSCSHDKLQVSKSGALNFWDREVYCGYNRVGVLSYGNTMNIALETDEDSPGGSMLCSVRVQPSCDCGWQDMRRIVGGHETQINEFPFMVGIVDVIIHHVICGGSIISKRYVLTAAHCLINKAVPEIGLLVGDHDYDTRADTNSTALYRAQRLISHQQFDRDTLDNDIALIQLEKPIVYSREVGPVCLPYTNLNPITGQEVTALGWGSLGLEVTASAKLMKVTLKVTNLQHCQIERQILGDNITTNHICTYGTGKDSCRGDSGGPLVWFDPQAEKLKLAGIISYGSKCGFAHSGVNTRVTSYTDWIEQNTYEQFCVA